ncbi:hypothetical protein VARIO8X_70013 [Burkholderiales bacterium 8X]|nr:hypothetical protein VARIO8X_70013 [Burkholderiales bacterium 8X]
MSWETSGSLLKSGLCQAQRSLLAGKSGVGLRGGVRGAQQVGQRRLAGLERDLDKLGTLAQQGRTLAGRRQLPGSVARRGSRGLQVGVEPVPQALRVRIGNVEFADRCGLQRRVAAVGTERNANPHADAALQAFAEARRLLAVLHGQLGCITPRDVDGIELPLRVFYRLHGQTKFGVRSAFGRVGGRHRRRWHGRQRFEAGERAPLQAQGCSTLCRFDLGRLGLEQLGTRDQRVRAREIAGAHAPLHVVRDALQVLPLGTVCLALRLGGGQLPGGLVYLAGEAQPHHVELKVGHSQRGVGGGAACITLAGQPQRPCDADLGLTATRVRVQSIVEVAQLQGRRTGRQAARGNLVGAGTHSLGIGFAGLHGAQPGGFDCLGDRNGRLWRRTGDGACRLRKGRQGAPDGRDACEHAAHERWNGFHETPDEPGGSPHASDHAQCARAGAMQVSA